MSVLCLRFHAPAGGSSALWLLLAIGLLGATGCSKARPVGSAAQHQVQNGEPPLGESDQVNVWRIRNVTVTRERAEALARQFGMGAPPSAGIRIDDKTFEQIVVTDREAELTLFRNSGTLRYSRKGFAEPRISTSSLPSAEQSVQIARDFLASNSLLPPDPDVTPMSVFAEDLSGNFVDHSIRVTFSPQLVRGLVNGAPDLAPVSNGDVAVWIGEGGRVMQVASSWRPVESVPVAVSLIPESDARRHFQQANPDIDVSQLEFALMYVSRDSFETQAYFDPIYLISTPNPTLDSGVANRFVGGARDTQPNHGDETRSNVLTYGAERATSFGPRLELLAPGFEGGIDGAAPIRLTYRVLEGSPPYRARVFSNKQGPMHEATGLIAGQVVNADLAFTNGRHELTFTITDANGMDVQAGFPAVVTNAPEPPFNSKPALPDDEIEPPVPLNYKDFEAGDFASDELAGKPKGDPVKVSDTSKEQVFKGPRNALELNPGSMITKIASPSLATYRRTAELGLIKKSAARAYLYWDQFRYQMKFVGITNPDGAQLVIRSNKCKAGRFFDATKSPYLDNKTFTPDGRSCDVPKCFAVPVEISPTYIRNFTPTEWPDPDVDARNSTTGALESYVKIVNLPGTFELRFLYQYGSTLCAPSPLGWAQLGADFIGAAGARRLGFGRCPAFIPEVDWKYTPPEGGVLCQDLKKYCRLNRGADAAGLFFCGWVPPSGGRPTEVTDIDNLCTNDQRYAPRFDVQLYTRIEHGGGTYVLTRSGFLSDDATANVPKAYKVDDRIDKTRQPDLAPGDFATHILPIAKERSGLFAAEGFDWADRISPTPRFNVEFDNYHQKSILWSKVTRAELDKIKRVLGGKWRPEIEDATALKYRDTVAFLGCNALNDPWDEEPCLHMHERWWGGAQSFGPQYNGDNAPAAGGVPKDKSTHEIRYLAVKVPPSDTEADRIRGFTERYPNHDPELLVNGEVLNTQPGVLSLLWYKADGTTSCKVKCTGKLAPECCRTHQAPIWWGPP